MVHQLLQTTGINLDRGGGIRELAQFQEHFKEYRIVVFSGLNCEKIYFDGQVESQKRINLLYDEVDHHYHVINNIKGAMAIQYVCKGCNKGCWRDVTHSAISRVATECRFLRERSQVFEFRAIRVIEILGVRLVLTDIIKIL